MLHKETKKRIDDARNILVGQLPLPSDQIELITIALIYKFMDDQDEELRQLGLSASFFKDGLRDYSWQKLMSNEISADERVTKFINGIEAIQKAKHIPVLFRDIFNNTFLKFRDGRTLQLFLKTINGFIYDHSEELGNAFEYLLMVMGTQADNGQFRTPRNIIDFIVEVVDPGKEDSILDPACGTGGFLVSAYKHILRKNTSGYEDYRITLDNYDIEGIPINWGDKLSTLDKDKISKSIEGYDITPMMVRLARVNMYLHQFGNPRIHEYDTLSFDSRWKDKYSCILANPPFMTPRGFTPAHDRFYIKANKAEVLFSDYILEHLTQDGKAGFIVPEGIVFQNSNDYITLRKWATEEAGLWAIISLPANIFQPYSGVKTSILFIDRNLARQRDEILLLKVENDGFSLNTNRTPVSENDLPAVLDLMRLCKDDLPKFKEKYITHHQKGNKLKYKLLTRIDFAFIDSYRSYNTAWSFIRKQFEKMKRIENEIEDKIAETSLLLKSERNKEKTEKLRQAISKLNEKYDKNWQDFSQAIGFEVKKKSVIKETVLKSWYDQNLKEHVIAYGTQLKEGSKLTKILRSVLDSERDYNWSLDRYIVNSRVVRQSNFELAKVRDLCLSILSGGTPKTSITRYWNGDIPWISSADILDLNTIIPRKYISTEGLENSSTNLIPKDNIVVVTRVGLGKIAINKIDVCISQDIQGLILDTSKVNLIYFAYFLQLEVQKFKETGTGVTIKGVTKSDLEELSIPLPTLEIQEQIVTEINRNQRIIDGCNLIIENYQPLFEVDETWEQVSLSDVCELDPKRPKVEENILISFLPMSDLNYYEYNVKPSQTKMLNATRGYTYFGVNDVLVAKITPCFENGKMGLVKELTNNIGFGSTEYFVLRSNGRILPAFLFFTLCNPIFNKLGQNNMSGSAGQQRVSKSFINNFKIYLPPLNTQQAIVLKLENDLNAVTQAKRLKNNAGSAIQFIINHVWGIKGS